MADFGGELDVFRTETRAWLEANCPASMRTPMTGDETPWGGRKFKWKNPDSKVWLDRMAEKGWTAPMWPKAYGGGGLSAAEARVLEQELARIKARPALFSFGVWMLGRYDDVHAAARDSATFSSTDGILLRSFGASAVVFAQPPDHTRLRRVAAPIFNKRAVGDLTSEIRQLASAGIAPLRTGEVVDLVQSLTIPMPINVIAQMLGIPRGNWADFRSMSEHFAGIF